MIRPYFRLVLQDSTAPVDTFIPVSLRAPKDSSSLRALESTFIPSDARRLAEPKVWRELVGLGESQGGCRYGCKVYVKRRGAVVEAAVLHSSGYGHARSGK